MHKPHFRTPALCALACAVLAAASCAGGAAPKTVSEIQRVAHRGGGALAPENTLAAFRAGIDSSAHALELDVHLSADGALVVIHDPDVKRTTDGSGLVADMTLAELKSLDAGAKFRGPAAGTTGAPGASVPAIAPGRQEIPTLDEVLDLVAPAEDIGLQVEIKLRADKTRYPGLEAALVGALRASGLVDRTTVISFDFPSLAAVRELEPRLRTCALVGKDFFKAAGKAQPDDIARSLASLGVDGAGVREQNLTPALYRALRAAGLSVGAWTVDDPRRMRQLAALGVDFITSNRPDVLGKTLQ